MMTNVYVRKGVNGAGNFEKQQEELLHHAKKSNGSVVTADTQFGMMIANASMGDEILVTDRERISTNPEELLSLVDEMLKKNISLVENGEKIDLVKWKDQLLSISKKQ